MINDFDMSEVILEKRRKEKDPFYKQPPVIIVGLIVSAIIIIGSTILIIQTLRGDKNQSSLGNYILRNIRSYLKELTKYAISEKRIETLLKGVNGKGDRFDDLVTLENSWLKVGWEQLNTLPKKDELFKQINEKFLKLFPSLPKSEDPELINKLHKIMIEEDDIEKYKDDENIMYINNNLKDKKLREEINLVFLYAFVNLPMQMGIFSKPDYKTAFLAEIGKQMKVSPAKEIFNNLNQDMPELPKNPIYIVLGAGQGEERKRITTVEPFANICLTGIRTQSTQTEVQGYLPEDLEKYYTNPDFRKLMELSRVNGKFTDDEYEKFVEECNTLKENLTVNNALELFNRYNFSVETANTVVEYLKLNVLADKINIIRLGEKNEANKNYVYDKDQVYILFDIVDVEETVYKANGTTINIFRATTVANAKTLIYLSEECPNFMPKDAEFVLVSGKSYAERQLQAFNIVYGLNSYDLQLHYVIWNKKENPEYNEETMVKTMMDFGVKGFNVISNTIRDIYGKEPQMAEKNDFIKSINQITNDAKKGNY